MVFYHRHLLLSLLLLLVVVKGTIVRLECRLHANFSIQRKGHRYESTPLEVYYKVQNASACAVLCVSRNFCDFINYNYHSLNCELIQTDDYIYDNNKLKPSQNWLFMSTTFSLHNVSLLKRYNVFSITCRWCKYIFCFFITVIYCITALKMKFKDFFSKCDQIPVSCGFGRIYWKNP